MISLDELSEVDRCARAYGFEIGRGRAISTSLDVSDDNPFLDPNWREHVVAEAPSGAPTVPFFPALAASLVYTHIKGRLEPTDQHVAFGPADVYVVSFSFVLGNWKALVSTTLPDGMYYEVTRNLLMEETYITSYKQWEHKTIPDES